ncbi:bifunctional PIG-L family deacetylase/class I SAM-dependent methyltransferase [Microbacterium testaceum]|uniref:bifunctional PIG-L family deacetylase/class I SAM-dependent methyltransferase n=1 Tax=Microbacterium testaceum TaxID=2033 RepID=UPI0022E6AF2E|nr:bifunctional PIG-L family deacetylase/class I SAM-dependent methyltransferase [Microbacterium testaceum]
MVSFDHREPGTDESVWAAALASRRLPPVDLDVDRIVVVAAHPDDECLGAGGLLATAAGRGIPIDVVVATDGEGSHPASPTHSPAGLARRRRAELAEAMDRIGVEGLPVLLGLPDASTGAHRRVIAETLDALLRRGDARRVLVLSTWRGDGHHDHRVVGEVAEQVAAVRGARHRAFPIWLWHWGTPDDVPWDRAERAPLGSDAAAAKARALGAHRSQIAPLSDAPGDETMLHAGMRAHFARDVEVFFAPVARTDAAPAPAPAGQPGATDPAAEVRPTETDADPASVGADYFDDMYARHDDPWGFDSRWYEKRKRAAVLAALPRRHYRAVFEAGCSTGALTAALAARADRVLAVDLSEAALARARLRLAAQAHVELRRALLPQQWPQGAFDLIVLSEVAYYWGAADLERGLAAAVAALDPDGHVVACHWRHPVAEYPLTGDEVHAALAAVPGLARLVRHVEDDFVLEVYGRAGAPSVAAEAGLV